MTDNGRQFVAAEFQTFADQWGLRHITSSPYFPQANGEAELAVRGAKKILSQDDPFLALLAHRSTPSTATGCSPSELSLGRRLRSRLPTLPENLEPQLQDKQKVIERDLKMKNANQHYFNKRHGACNLPELQPGEVVLQKLDGEKKWTSPATVLKRCNPRSYLIKARCGAIRRGNRRHLKPSRFFHNRNSPTIHISGVPPSQSVAAGNFRAVSFSGPPAPQTVLTSHVQNVPTLTEPSPEVPKTLTPAGSQELSAESGISQPKPVQPPGTTDVPNAAI